jgi:hypothetical protein
MARSEQREVREPGTMLSIEQLGAGVLAVGLGKNLRVRSMMTCRGHPPPPHQRREGESPAIETIWQGLFVSIALLIPDPVEVTIQRIDHITSGPGMTSACLALVHGILEAPGCCLVPH